MTPEQMISVPAALIAIAIVLAFYVVVIMGTIRLVRWFGRTAGAAVQTSRTRTMLAEGKPVEEIDAILDEHVLSRHWWVMPVVAVIIVAIILPPAGIFLGLMFLIRLAKQWPNMRRELDERARLRAERIAARRDPPR
jgi:hypothetical protein